MITIEEIEDQYGDGWQEWPGNCYVVATAAAKLIEGSRAVYGHYKGPIDESSMFYNRGPITHHGWVSLPDGQVLDALRWEFEGAAPYVHVGSIVDYDEGGNEFRMANLGDPPAFDAEEKMFEFSDKVLPSSDAWIFIENMLGLTGQSLEHAGKLTYSQMHWLANVAPQLLGGHAIDIYKALEKLGVKAHIPIDNYDMVMAAQS